MTPIEALRRAIRIWNPGRPPDEAPDEPTVGAEQLLEVAQIFGAEGDLVRALDLAEKALCLEPARLPAHHFRTLVLEALGRFDACAAAARRCQTIHPPILSRFCLTRMIALFRAGRVGEAVAAARVLIAVLPDDGRALGEAGKVLAADRRLPEARLAFRAAVRLHPSQGAFLNHAVIMMERDWGRGISHMSAADVELQRSSVRCLERAVALDPAYAQGWYVGAHYRWNLGDADAGETLFRRALRLDPSHQGAHHLLGSLLMLKGDLQEGGREFEWRPSHIRHRIMSPSVRVWDGRPCPDANVLLIEEGGAGDTIQMIRYLPDVARRCQSVVLSCSPRLTRLLAPWAAAAGVAVNPSGIPRIDAAASLLSLPHLLGTTRDAIPAPVPYLKAEPEGAARWRERLAGVDGLRVGVAWYTANDPSRRFPLARLRPLAALPGVRLISLQKGTGSEEAEDPATGVPLLVFPDLDEGPDAFVDTAALMANLDAVVTNDTSIAHVAGALGRPTWVCLARIPDWRWFLDDDRSPWYPSVRLMRQLVQSDWSGVFERLVEEIRAFQADSARRSAVGVRG